MHTRGRTPAFFSDEEEFRRVFHSKQRVVGLTHQFYRYPARFSPEFARHVISELSEPGDAVLDPFMGGGTTIVEALALGRRVAGLDINGLSHFVTQVKTTPLSKRDASQLLNWGDRIQSCIIPETNEVPVGLNYGTKNLPEEVRRFFEAALSSLPLLRFPRQRRFARCVLLKVGQWALDCRMNIPNTEELCLKAVEEVQKMLSGLREFEQVTRNAGVPQNKITANRLLSQGSITDLETLRSISRRVGTLRLVLTSPPYPGVHILYHRWQVFGRRETPAPYWLADLRDGHGASHYTMGSRSDLGMRKYFSTLRQGFECLKTILSPNTLVVQLVAFSDATTQLPTYRNVLSAAGYDELPLSDLQSGMAQIRTVPHRKWYTNGKDSDADQEILMIHRPRHVTWATSISCAPTE